MDGIEQHEPNDSASSLIDQLYKAVHELEAFNGASESKVHWTEIEQYFCNLKVTLKKKSEDLEAKEKEYEVKEAKTIALIVEKETIVATKEQDYLDHVQELKNAAVASIAEARASFQSTTADSLDAGENGDTKPRPELTHFCEQMDAEGLLNFITENQNFINEACRELLLALESASRPTHLVFSSLEGFYPPDETTPTVDKMDAALQGMRKSCVLLLEAMASFLARIDPGDTHLLNPEIKQLAKAIADEWKPKLSNVGSVAADDNSLEAEAFLQLLATFKIASEFDEEHLCKLVFVVAHLRQAPELCRSIGLALKMPGLFELLINSGRKVDAIRFIHTFQLSERFPPVPLLKMFLKDLLRNSQGKGGNSRAAYGSQDDINARELAALEAVISCLQDYGLEADYSLDPLQKRLAQLEKAKADSKKRGGDSSKHHPWKKSRPNGGFRGFRGPPGRQAPQVYNQRAAFTGRPERYTPACSNPYSYQVLYQPAYAPQANDQRLYYYTQDDKIPTPLYNATTSNYGSYSGGGLQPSQQPYM
ncbi:FRIGIDA-like protein 3 isoform X1 [Hibiscus syriacus]|uniref:FRIGIDA-like protein 3 isoform X1 n=1 Tax=Hibiscus syriacus TaxID=106335 RepID=UPI0019218DE8|nr:FRIGIDA-like protein 3 isoform X1 [Hibiscus syriacus]